VSAEAWQALVTELYGRRAQAFATGSGALLSGVYASDSPALADDVRAVGELAASHRQVEGFAPRVVRVDGVTVTGDTAVLRLVDDWAGYRVVAASGAPPGSDAVSSVPARAEQQVRMTLTRTVRGWRIASVVREG
jgi:hypothetical protein